PATLTGFNRSYRLGALSGGNSLDHLVGAGEHARWHVEAERLRGLEVNHHLELGGCLHRKVTSILTFEDAVDVRRRPPGLFNYIDAVREQTTVHCPRAIWINGRQAMSGCQSKY